MILFSSKKVAEKHVGAGGTMPHKDDGRPRRHRLWPNRVAQIGSHIVEDSRRRNEAATRTPRRPSSIAILSPLAVDFIMGRTRKQPLPKKLRPFRSRTDSLTPAKVTQKSSGLNAVAQCDCSLRPSRQRSRRFRSARANCDQRSTQSKRAAAKPNATAGPYDDRHWRNAQ